MPSPCTNTSTNTNTNTTTRSGKRTATNEHADRANDDRDGDDGDIDHVHVSVVAKERRPHGRVYRVGNTRMMWGEHLFEMNDSTALLADLPHSASHLRDALSRDGYLLLRSFLPTDAVLHMRQMVATALRDEWGIIARTPPSMSTPSPSSPSLRMPDATSQHAARGLLLTGYRPLTHDPASLALVHSERLARLFSTLFDEAPSTFDTKWLRVLGRNESTDEHSDYYRFAQHAADMYTCWIPLGDYRVEASTLAVCEGSHRLIKTHAQGRARTSTPSAGAATAASSSRNESHESHEMKSEVELPHGFTSVDPHDRTRRWCTTDFRPGDLVVFDIRLIHASTANQAHDYRISTDTRWQPSSRIAPHRQAMFHAFAFDPLGPLSTSSASAVAASS